MAAQVEQFPGLHLRELARTTQVDVPLAKYHLDRLVREGLVSQRQSPGFVRYYPCTEGTLGRRDLFDPLQKRWLALLRRPLPLHMVAVLLERGAATPEELCQRLGVSHGTLHYHLRRMEARGLVLRERDGRSCRYQLANASAVEGLIVRCRPPDALVQGFLETWDALGLS